MSGSWLFPWQTVLCEATYSATRPTLDYPACALNTPPAILPWASRAVRLPSDTVLCGDRPSRCPQHYVHRVRWGGLITMSSLVASRCALTVTQNTELAPRAHGCQDRRALRNGASGGPGELPTGEPALPLPRKPCT